MSFSKWDIQAKEPFTIDNVQNPVSVIQPVSSKKEINFRYVDINTGFTTINPSTTIDILNLTPPSGFPYLYDANLCIQNRYAPSLIDTLYITIDGIEYPMKKVIDPPTVSGVKTTLTGDLDGAAGGAVIDSAGNVVKYLDVALAVASGFFYPIYSLLNNSTDVVSLTLFLRRPIKIERIRLSVKNLSSSNSYKYYLAGYLLWSDGI